VELSMMLKRMVFEHDMDQAAEGSDIEEVYRLICWGYL